MKQYIKQVNGKNTIKTSKEIVIKKDGRQIINPTEEQILADGWVEFVRSEPSEELLLIRAKSIKRREIIRYDSSSDVNIFYIQDIPVWLDKATRAGLMLRFQAEAAVGKTDTTLWYNGKVFELLIENAFQMLYAIEVYASACYDNTQKHLSVIDNLETVNEVEAYDYKIGYPDNLKF